MNSNRNLFSTGESSSDDRSDDSRFMNRRATIPTVEIIDSSDEDSSDESELQDVINEIVSKEQLFSEDEVSESDFVRLKVLGTGAYGRVFLVKKLSGKDKGSLYAMKVLSKAKFQTKPKCIEYMKAERKILESIIGERFLAQIHYAFQTASHLFLILDFEQGGELFTHLAKQEHFSESQSRFYIAQVILAIEKLHKRDVVYRDIKLENILLDSLGYVVVADFGLSKELAKGKKTRSYCGTVDYMAPEVVMKKNKGYGPSADWWSVGVLLVEMLTGETPFPNCGDDDALVERILHEEPNIPRSVGRDARDLILQLLQKKPSERLGYQNGADGIKCHRFFRKLNWEKLETRKYAAPLVHAFSGPDDVSQFADEFTEKNVNEMLDEPSLEAPIHFPNFSFIAPQWRSDPSTATLSHTSDIPDLRPCLQDVLNMELTGESMFFQKYYISAEHVIGEGTFSICLQVTSKETKKEFAAKIMKLSHDAKQEIAALEACQGHPNIVELIEIVQDEQFQYIVFELLSGGELLTHIRECYFLTEPVARGCLNQLVSAVEFMHGKGFIHRDLKADNIVFVDGDKSQLKIIDFGFACQKGSYEAVASCTLEYAAPESLRAGKANEPRDMWTLGAILYTMLAGQPPFTLQTVSRDVYDKDPLRLHEVSLEAQQLIEKLLEANEEDRLTMEELRADKWLTEEDRNDTSGNVELTAVETDLIDLLNQNVIDAEEDDISGMSDLDCDEVSFLIGHVEEDKSDRSKIESAEQDTDLDPESRSSHQVVNLIVDRQRLMIPLSEQDEIEVSLEVESEVTLQSDMNSVVDRPTSIAEVAHQVKVAEVAKKSSVAEVAASKQKKVQTRAKVVKSLKSMPLPPPLPPRRRPEVSVYTPNGRLSSAKKEPLKDSSGSMVPPKLPVLSVVSKQKTAHGGESRVINAEEIVAKAKSVFQPRLQLKERRTERPIINEVVFSVLNKSSKRKAVRSGKENTPTESRAEQKVPKAKKPKTEVDKLLADLPLTPLLPRQKAEISAYMSSVGRVSSAKKVPLKDSSSSMISSKLPVLPLALKPKTGRGGPSKKINTDEIDEPKKKRITHPRMHLMKEEARNRVPIINDVVISARKNTSKRKSVVLDKENKPTASRAGQKRAKNKKSQVKPENFRPELINKVLPLKEKVKAQGRGLGQERKASNEMPVNEQRSKLRKLVPKREKVVPTVQECPRRELRGKKEVTNPIPVVEVKASSHRKRKALLESAFTSPSAPKRKRL